MDELIGKCKHAYSCRKCGDENETTFATVAHARAEDAEGRAAATTSAFTNAESLAADRMADAGLAQVDPERPKVDGFAVEKAHLKESRCQRSELNLVLCFRNLHFSAA